MKLLCCSACLMLVVFALAGCSRPDPPSAPEHSPPASAERDVSPGASDPVASDDPYALTPFRVLTVSEQDWEGFAALSVRFSLPLDAEQQLGRYLRVHTPQGRWLEGDWILNESGTQAVFPYVDTGQTYHVVVAEQLRARNGRQLDAGARRSVQIQQATPALRFTQQGAQLSPRLNTGLEVETVNMTAVDLDLWRIDNDKIAAFLGQSWSRAHHYYSGHLNSLNTMGKLLYTGRFDFADGNRQRVTRVIGLENLSSHLDEPGVYLAVATGAGHYGSNRATTWFTVSDLGMHLRRYDGSLSVWLHGLNDASEQSGISVQLLGNRGEVLDSAVSDQRGFVRLQGAPDSANERAVMAHKGGQLALVRLQGPAMDTSAYGLSSRPHRALELFIYSPRDIYRPGEEVIVNALLRDNDGRQVQAQPLRAELRRPDGRTHSTHTLPGDEHSFYTLMQALPADAATGRWQFVATLGSGQRFEYPFQVEDFLPERMTLTLGSEQPQPLSVADDIQLQVQVNYLWGAPASGNRLETHWQLQPARQISRQYRDFHFGFDDHRARQQGQLPELNLDQHGRGSLLLSNNWRNLRQPLQVSLEVSVFESGGRPVSRRWQQTLWPEENLVGVRPAWSGDIASPNDSVFFEVIQLNARDQLTARDYLDVQLVREDSYHYWQRGNRGWQGRNSSTEAVVYNRVVALHEGESLQLSMPVEYGNYRLELRDREGTLLNRYEFFAGWHWHRAQGDQGVRPEQVQLAWNAGAYRGGDTAVLTLTSPFDGEGLVTVESDELLWQGRVAVRDGTGKIAIPVDRRWQRHDIHATAMVLRPALQRSASLPRRGLGILPLPLERSDRQLRLELEAPRRVEPETVLPVTLRLSPEQAGEQVSVTLAAVDSGVLSLTNFVTPDPFGFFFGPRRYGVEVRDSYSDLFEISEAPLALQRFGGDADDLSRGGDAPMSDVQIVSLYTGKVTLDAEGRAELNLRLPYFNGELRLMAVAFDRRRVGSADTRVTVAAPVVAEINLPRFLALGDTTEAVLDIQNLLPASRQLEVVLSADHQLGGQSLHETLTLSPSGGADNRQWLRLPLEAQSASGQGEITMTLRSLDGKAPALNMERQWRLGMRPAFPVVRKSQQLRLGAGETVELSQALVEQARPDTLEAALSISRTPPLTVDDHLNFLLQYPYGCAEQTSSRLWPLVLASGADAARIERFFQERARTGRDSIGTVLEQGFSRLAGMQQADGGFGLWSADHDEARWITVYIVDLLHTAQQRGFPVDNAVLGKALQRLEHYARGHSSGAADWQRHYQASYTAYASLVLARAGRGRLADARNLYDHRADHIQSPLAMAQLALALELLGDIRRAGEAWRRALSWQGDPAGYLGDYGTPVRDLAATMLLARESELIAALDLEVWSLALQLRDNMIGRDWYSTQEHMALYRLAIVWQSMAADPWQAELQFASDSLALDESRQWSRFWRTGNWSGDARLHNQSAGSLFVNFTLQGYPEEMPEPLVQGLEISRDYYSLDGEPLDPSRLHSGDFALVKLSVRSLSGRVRDALVVELLPAGLELENQNLVHARRLDDLRINNRSVGDWQRQTRLVYREFRDDRFVAALDLHSGQTAYLFYLARAVTPGVYRIPPSMVEDMYRPELRGYSASPGRVQVIGGARAGQ